MTPQLLIKLLAQIARQSPELAALETQIAAAQPSIDSAQTWRNSTQAALESAQAALAEAQAVEGADVSAQQGAVGVLSESLTTADADLSALTGPRDALVSRADALRASIAQCQAQIDAGGLVMTGNDIDAMRLASVRAQVWERIKAKRDALAESGCKVGAYWFHNDVKSRGQWERMVNRLEKTGASDADPYTVAGYPVPWKTLTGDKVVLTAGIIRGVVAAFEIQEAMIFGAAESHRAAVNASATPSAYDFSAGWPAGFTG